MNATITKNHERYLTGRDSFVPEPNDNPDCIPFYSAWAGMREVLGKETMDRWHHLFHEAICWGSNKPRDEQYDTIISHCLFMCSRGGRTEEPRYSYSWECAPSEPTDEDARQFFNREYKVAFPDKRANSKHANALWIEKRDKALSILRDQYLAQFEAYEKRELKREEENNRRREEWINASWSLAEFENLVRALQVETGE